MILKKSSSMSTTRSSTRLLKSEIIYYTGSSSKPLSPLQLAIKQGDSIKTKTLVNMGEDIFAKSGLLGTDTPLTQSRDQVYWSPRDKERQEVFNILSERRVKLFRSLQRLALGVGLHISHDKSSIEDRSHMDYLTEFWYLGKNIADYMNKVRNSRMPLGRVPCAHPLIFPDQWLRYHEPSPNLLRDADNKPET